MLYNEHQSEAAKHLGTSASGRCANRLHDKEKVIPNLRTRQGMALVMVIAVLATAAVLAYALLSVNSIQATLGSSLTTSANSEYVAESGVNVAMYYLQYPTAAPSAWISTSGYKLYAAAVPVNDSTPSAFDVHASATPARDVYTISSTGYPVNGSPFSHTVNATVRVNRAKITAAGVFGGNITLPLHTAFSDGGVSGAAALQANGIVTVNGAVTGTQLAAPLASGSYTPPGTTTVNYYGVGMTTGTYLWTDGVTLGTPQQINTGTLTNANLPAVAANNPAAIFYHTGNLTVNANLTLNGTLIVRGGNLTFTGSGAAATFTPAAQFPALVCEKITTIIGKNFKLTANGVVFFGTGFTWAGASNAGSKCGISGALVMPAGAAIGSTSNGNFTVTYNAANADVPGLTQFDQQGLSVRVETWSQ